MARDYRRFGASDSPHRIDRHVDDLKRRYGVDEKRAMDMAGRDFGAATFGRGPVAGKTGNPFKDDPFFNPWAEGGAFNKPRRR